MGRYLFRLPDVGEGTAEAEIVVWHVAVGDTIAEDQSLVDVMTDKATVDMTSPVSGKVTATHGDVGAMMPVGSVLVELEVDGPGNVDGKVPVGTVPSKKSDPVLAIKSEPAQAQTSEPTFATSSAEATGVSSRSSAEEAIAAPATRRRAHELGIALQHVRGTGPAGRITPEDLDAYVSAGARVAGDTRYTARNGLAETKIFGLRRKIAEKMQQSKRRIPHINYVEECDVTELEELRNHLNDNRGADQPKLTFLPFLMRALVRVLPEFPQINAQYDDEAGVLRTHEGVHIGLATQTSSGLMVPVVRNAETFDVWELASEIARLATGARNGTVQREELSGSTITITSLGALGGIAATPVINYPEVAIIAPNKIVERPVVKGQFVSARRIMNLSSAFDHRIIDGYDAARFIQSIKRRIEHPALIFMD